MKCISLWQPWATAMALGYKRIETRSWRPPQSVIGQEFAIHAAKKWDKELADFTEFLDREGVDVPRDPFLGGIVAVGRLVDFHPTEHLVTEVFGIWHFSNLGKKLEMGETELNLGNYERGRIGWVFEDLKPIEPIPFKGQQGIWTLSDEVADQVRRAVKS